MTEAQPGNSGSQPRLASDGVEQASVWGDLDPGPYAWLEREEREALEASLVQSRGPGVRGIAARAGVGLAALWLFFVALALMKDGAQGLAPVLGATIDSALSALGFGWLGALLVLSGSPVAASSLALLEGGSLGPSEAYAMMVGSRLGAAFVVLVVGAVYAVRGGGERRRTPLSVGVLALAMTAVIYIPGGIVGGLILEADVFRDLTLTPPPAFFDVIDAITAPLVGLILGAVDPSSPVGGGAVFILGVVVLLGSFKLVDQLLPTLESARGDERARWYVGPWTMFGIGLLVALATLSVAVSISLLVPLVAKGYVRREQTLTYIAGANITTLVDTFIVAILLDSDMAPRLVLALLVGIGTWTVLLILLFRRQLRRLAFGLQAVVLREPRRLALFVLVLFACPVVLIVLG